MGKAKLKAIAQATILKLDLGCGPHPREGFTGVDCRKFGQAITADLTMVWPWESDSVTEAHSSHFIEHLNAPERIHFINELYRVLKPEAKCTLIVPHWNSCRAYGDLTHQWPPVSEFWFYYLSKAWRAQNAPHNDGYLCDFEAVWGYGMRPDVAMKNPEYQQYAMANYKEAITDIHATLTKKV